MEEASFFSVIIDVLTLPILCGLVVSLSFFSFNWLIERTSDPKLRALPASLFEWVYSRLHPHTERLVNQLIGDWVPLPDLFEAFEPEKMSIQSVDALKDYSVGFVDELMRSQNPVLWDNLPNLVRHRVYRKAEILLEPIVDEFIDHIGSVFDEIFDYESLIRKQFNKMPRLVHQFTLDALFFFWQSIRERSILIASILGMLFTLLDILDVIPSPIDSPLFLCGFLLISAPISIVLGYLSCLFGLKKEARKMGSASFLYPTSTLWLHQQQHFNLFASHLFATKVFHFPELIEHIFSSRKHFVQIRHIMRKSLQPITEGLLLKAMTQVFFGPSALVSIKNQAIEQALNITSIPLNNSLFVKHQTDNLNQCFKGQLEKIPNAEFFELLHPIIQEVLRWLLAFSCISGIFLGLLYTLLS